MKKLLFVTSALAMSFGVSGALAMGGAEISVSGNSKWTYKDISTQNTDNGTNATSFGIGNTVTFASEAVSDSGLTYGTSLSILDDGSTLSDDGMKLYIKGSFGEIRTGTASAGDTFGADATGAVEGEESPVSAGDFVGKSADNSLTYYTPTVQDFEAALTITDAGNDSDADSSEFGISFTTLIGKEELILQYAMADVSKNGKEGSDAKGATDAQSVGLKYSFGDINLTLAHNESTTDDADGAKEADVTSFGFGLTYPISDDLKLGLHSVDGEDKGDGTEAKSEFSEAALSLTYTIAPGLTTNLAYADYEDGGTSGSSTAAYIKVSF